MNNGFLALACFSGSIVFFAFFIKLEKAGAANKQRGYRSAFSQESVKKGQMVRWLFFSVGFVLLAGAVLFELLG